ncbi:hypothetical protein ACILPN_01500 [Yersinia wautersii]|uniref:Uncharacterized protein n=1 Tax=Yersinia pseudotuberculosis TaxID=633 RepID=A0A380QDW8_YERPU|nr:hypothetical protein [Yersinia pseudotuberculosis]SUP86182.1 Uncharacterised protein [Yersinia pseudotuberculosis]
MPVLARKFHQIVLAGLEQGYGVDDGHKYGGPVLLRYAAMGLSITHDWLQMPLDLDKLGLPRDPAWGSLIKYWNDPDPVKLQSILYSACDTHIERIALTEREFSTGNFDFFSVFMAVYPTRNSGRFALTGDVEPAESRAGPSADEHALCTNYRPTGVGHPAG